MTSTFNVPAGSTNHGDPNLLCVPPSWSDLAVFFGTNYLAHAATLIPRPGQSLGETIVDTVNALFIPGSGMIRAIRILIYDTDLHRTSSSLMRAAKAGALCMVIRRDHVYNATAGVREDWFSDHFVLSADPIYVPLSRSILGTCRIHDLDEYCLVEVPPAVPLREFMPGDDPSFFTDRRSSTYSPDSAPSSTRRPKSHKIEIPGKIDIAKILVSILQVIWGISTLYDAGGNQTDLYGYGAFGLTVAPYAVMSLLNLLASLAFPVHNTMYLVWNEDMSEATTGEGNGVHRGHHRRHRRPCEFAGMIATVDLPKAKREMRDKFDKQCIPYDEGGFLERPVRLAVYSLLYLLVAVIPLAIVGAFTGFRTGTDARIQRAWILAWLIFGSASPILISQLSATFGIRRRVTSFQRYVGQNPRQTRNIFGFAETYKNAWFALCILVPLWIPAIGGMVLVGKMLQDFGVCTRLD